MSLTTFHDLLDNAEPLKTSRGGRAGQFRFTAEDVVKMYEARKRGLSWGQINNILENAGEKNYTRPGSLAQSVHNAAKFHGIENAHSKRTKNGKALAHA